MLRRCDTMLRCFSIIAVVIPAAGCERRPSTGTAQVQPTEVPKRAGLLANQDGVTLSLRAAAGSVAVEGLMLRVGGPYLVQARVQNLCLLDTGRYR